MSLLDKAAVSTPIYSDDGEVVGNIGRNDPNLVATAWNFPEQDVLSLLKNIEREVNRGITDLFFMGKMAFSISIKPGDDGTVYMKLSGSNLDGKCAVEANPLDNPASGETIA